MLKIEAIYPFRPLSQSLGRRGAFKGHARAESVLQPHGDMNGWAQWGLTFAYTSVGTFTQMLLPGVFNAIDSDKKENFAVKSGKVIAGLALDGLVGYQVWTHAPIAEGAFHLVTQIPTLGPLLENAATTPNVLGVAAALLITKWALGPAENIFMDAIGTARKLGEKKQVASE